MTTWQSRARLGVYALLSTITLSSLAACGGDDPTTGAGSSDDSDESWTSPLDEYLGGGPFQLGGGGGVMIASRIGEADEQKDRQVEDEVAACMRDQGFEYVPYLRDDSAMAAFEEAESLDPDEYARQYGYGISTMGFGAMGDEEDEDPNTAIRAALSASAQESYDMALWGDMGAGMVVVQGGDEGEDDAAVGPEVTESEEGEPGCKQTSREKIYGAMPDQPMVDFAEFDGLFEDLQALEERITSDPEMVTAIDAWADCMAAAGYSDLDALEAPQMSIMDRMSDLFGAGGATGADGPEAVDPPAEPEGSNDAPSGPARLDPSDIDEEALAELRDDEIATAVADRECRSEHVDAVEADIRGAMETEFVDANRDLLERYRDQTAGVSE